MSVMKERKMSRSSLVPNSDASDFKIPFRDLKFKKILDIK